MKKKCGKNTEQKTERFSEEQDKKQKAINRAQVRSSTLCNSISTIMHIFKNENIDLDTLSEELGTQLKNTRDGKTSIIENMLMSQAQTLQALFHFAAQRISYCDIVSKVQIYGELAIKSNNACRKTLLAWQHLKNPTNTTFIKQQNNAHNQQINQDNFVTTQNEDLENPNKKNSNEVLINRGTNHALLDKRGENQTIAIDTSMATLEKINRSKN